VNHVRHTFEGLKQRSVVLDGVKSCDRHDVAPVGDEPKARFQSPLIANQAVPRKIDSVLDHLDTRLVEAILRRKAGRAEATRRSSSASRSNTTRFGEATLP
jgi:hypothetical protein